MPFVLLFSPVVSRGFKLVGMSVGIPCLFVLDTYVGVTDALHTMVVAGMRTDAEKPVDTSTVGEKN